MTRKKASRRIRGDLLDHPAVKAWSQLQPDRVEPEGIWILKGRRQRKGAKSSAYRLEGVGPAGASVVAKRCRRATARLERTIYEQILPRLPVTALRYYGYIQGPEPGFSWLFLEDAGPERCSKVVKEHRVAAARWLGLLHSSASGVAAAAGLPERGASYHLEHLRSARCLILSNLTNPALSPEDTEILTSLVERCDLLESRWGQLQRDMATMPRTLVHGDFKRGNIRVRTDGEGIVIVPFDWEGAGRGVPAVDLGTGIPDLPTYLAILRGRWPDVDSPTVDRYVRMGTLLRCLAGAHWAARSLPYDWLDRPMAQLRQCDSCLAKSVRGLA